MKITVITVCYNSEKTIEKTIKSVINQDHVDKEYIIIDGASTDSTLDIIKKYENYITKWVSEPDHGIFDAMNKGISLATGDIIAFLNSDDWYMYGALSAVHHEFISKKCDCVCCDNYVIDFEGNQRMHDASNVCLDDMYKRMIFYHSAIFTHKKWFEKKNNFNLKYKIAADYDWMLRVMKRGAKLSYLHLPVFTFCYGGISSVNKVACAREAWEIATAHLPLNRADYSRDIDNIYMGIALKTDDKKWILNKFKKVVKNDLPIILWGAGNRGKQCALWMKKAGIEIMAIVDKDETKIGNEISSIFVHSPKFLCNKVCNIMITPDDFKTEIWNEIQQIQGDFVIYDLKTLLLKMGKA